MRLEPGVIKPRAMKRFGEEARRRIVTMTLVTVSMTVGPGIAPLRLSS